MCPKLLRMRLRPVNDFVIAFIAYPAPIHTGPHDRDTNVTRTARPVKILGGPHPGVMP